MIKEQRKNDRLPCTQEILPHVRIRTQLTINLESDHELSTEMISCVLLATHTVHQVHSFAGRKTWRMGS